MGAAVVAGSPSSQPRFVSPRRALAILAALAALVGTITVVVPYRDQISSFLTHWKGAPDHTVPWVPFPPDAGALHLGVLGDAGDSGSRLDATAAALTRVAHDDPYHALLFLGDNVYPSGDPERLNETVFGPFAPVLDAGAEVLAVLGNHDVADGWGDAQLAALGMPGRWWARTFDDVLVVGLDSTEVDDPEQLAWLDATLTGSDARWKIVAVHHPPYSAGYQGSSRDVRERFTPLFARAGVQLVLSGHDHDYQRSIPIDGVTYVVTGAASGTRRTGDEAFTEVSFSWHHFVDVHVFPDRLVLRAVNQDGRVADEAVLRPGSVFVAR